MQKLLVAALLAILIAPQVSFAALLAHTSPGTYHLFASPGSESGTFFLDALRSRQSADSNGYVLAASEQKAGPRFIELDVWAGAKANGGQYMNAMADTRAEVVVLPEEGETSGKPITLYAQLFVRSFSGEVDFPTAPSASALIANAYVGAVHSGPSHSFSGPELVAIQAKIGVPIELRMFASALAIVGPSAQQYSYAAMDMQLVLSLDAKLPAPLTPLPAIPGDATMNGVVDGADYTVWADGFLKASNVVGWSGDFSRDGFVDGADYTIWADHFTPSGTTPTISAVPEPASFLLLTLGMLGGLSLALRRRSR